MVNTRAPQVIWMRVGFEDTYRPFLTVEAIADHLADFYGIDRVPRHVGQDQHGVTAKGFQNHNYISLFWGTDPDDRSGEKAELTRPLTDDEIEELNLSLESIRDCEEANPESES